MKYKISKAKVKEALIHENLKAGAFYNNEYDRSNITTCPVCAVGSILRAVDKGVKVSGLRATESYFLAEDLNEAYGYGNFLSKLSTEFETASAYESEPDDSDDMRMFLLFLTEAFCPDVLEFEV